MGYAERDQAEAVEYCRDAQPLVTGSEAETLPFPVTGVPDAENPGGRHHHSCLTTGPPGACRRGSDEDVRHPQQQQPKQEIGKQHARSFGSCALPKQAYAGAQRDEGAEIGQCLAPGHTLGHSCPCRGEIALDETKDSEGDHGYSKDRMTHACDAHRPIPRGTSALSRSGLRSPSSIG